MTQRPKRILMIAPLPPPVHGSAMMTQIIKESDEVNRAATLDWVNLSTSRSIDEIGGKSPVKLWRFAMACGKALGKLLTHRYSACYLAITCHGLGFLKDAPFVLLCKLLSGNVIIHQHNKGMAADVDRPLFKWLLPLTYRHTRVILLSERLYPDISRVVRPEQVMICPNGIPDVTSASSRPLTAGAPSILFLSNLIESKGTLVLLDALKLLRDSGAEFSCRMVGGESESIDTARINREIASRGLSDRVTYVGRKYGEEKEAEFRRADIFTLPTFCECFPLVILEAMAHSLPVVTTAEGAIPDMITPGVNGLLTERRSAPDLAAGLAQMLTMPPARRMAMGAEGRNRYLNHFTLSHFQENIKHCLTD